MNCPNAVVESAISNTIGVYFFMVLLCVIRFEYKTKTSFRCKSNVKVRKKKKAAMNGRPQCVNAVLVSLFGTQGCTLFRSLGILDVFVVFGKLVQVSVWEDFDNTIRYRLVDGMVMRAEYQ